VQLTLSGVERVEHRVGRREYHVSVHNSVRNVLTQSVVNLDLALLCRKRSRHRVTANIRHNDSHFFTKHVCLWQGNLNVFSLDIGDVVVEVFNTDG
jgi:hypothetical protein